LLAEVESFSVRQAFTWCTILTAISCALAAVRVRLLPAAKEYGLFVWLFVSWSCISASTVGVPLTSALYKYIFLISIPLSWVLYFWGARHLYQKIFSKYPGIAFAGRSALWLSAAIVIVGVVLSTALAPGVVTSKDLFAALILLDRCVLFGIAFFLVLLVSIMIRYPISIAKNIAVHAFFFASILFSQALLQAVDQWTGYRFTPYCNTIAAGFDAVLVSAWAVFLTNAGDAVIIRVRQHIRPETEVHLLGQLDALNGILLRAARK
jgi:hypothetical protein